MEERGDKKGRWKMWIPVIMAAGILLLYFFAAYPFYTWLKSRNMETAWERLEEMELDGLAEEDEEILRGFELKKLEFLIVDENFQLLYCTRKCDPESQVEQYIRKHVEDYQEKPKVSVRKGQEFRILRMRGLIRHKDKAYYIYIRKDIQGAGEAIRYSSVYSREQRAK